ncbi:major facilitator superfamily domain-containing protein [Scleroderma yunnanense]
MHPLLQDSKVEAQTVVAPPMAPTPKGHILALCAVRFIYGMAFTQLFPYVNNSMSNLHLTSDPTCIGFCSGLVESTFPVSQLFTIYAWARLSDTIGHRPVILLVTFATAILMLMFGLSKLLLATLITRSLDKTIIRPNYRGLFSGVIAVLQSALAKNTDSTNQAATVAIYGLMSLIGGIFAHRASKHPSLFSYAILKENPYFLPYFVTLTIIFFTIFFIYTSLQETIPSKCIRGKHSPLTMWELMALPGLFSLMKSGFALSFIATAFDVVFIFYCYSPVQAGGLALSALQIGYALSTSGSITMGLQLFIMPHLLQMFDSEMLYTFFMTVWPFAYFCLPFLNIIACGGSTEDGKINAYTNGMLCIVIAIIHELMDRTSSILVKEHSLNVASLSWSNKIVQFSMCLRYSFAFFTVSFFPALCLPYQSRTTYFWTIIMVAVSIVGSVCTRNIS